MRSKLVMACAFCGVVLATNFAPVGAQEIKLSELVDELLQDGSLVGAQMAVGQDQEIAWSLSKGSSEPGKNTPVNPKTLFCIGSCSKPFASAVAMILMEDGLVELEQPVANYLPEFSDLRLESGEAIRRQPTLKELLTHRSGIYSQKRETTASQKKWIRDFGLTLNESVTGIASEPLIAKPGTDYHYSGAGYCVAGRVCEVVANQSFEQIFQLHIAAPLELKRTTYYPDARDRNVASGGSNGKADPNTPHLTKPELKLPLIGGSLYSTAEETCRFLNMVVHEGLYGGERLMTKTTWKTWLSQPFPDGNYGYGWGHVPGESEPIAFHHGGALYSSRSAVLAIPSTKTYGVVHYTIGSLANAKSKQVNAAIRTGLRNELRSLSKPR